MSVEETYDQSVRLKIARWRHTSWGIESHEPQPGLIGLRPDEGHGAHAICASCVVCTNVIVPATFVEADQ